MWVFGAASGRGLRKGVVFRKNFYLGVCLKGRRSLFVIFFVNKKGRREIFYFRCLFIYSFI